MNLGPLFDYGESLRDTAIATVMENAGQRWQAAATQLIQDTLRGQEVLAEEWRLLCEHHGLNPHHPNAWGGLTNSLVRSGVITDTGRLGKSRDPRSHARRQPVWRVRG
jgi:hypothetical protein